MERPPAIISDSCTPFKKKTFWPATMWTCCEVQVYLGAVALNLVRSLWWYNHVSLSSKTCSPKPQLITVNLSLTWHGLQLRIFLFAASKAWPRGLRPPCARSLCTPVTSENFGCSDSFAEENQETHRCKKIAILAVTETVISIYSPLSLSPWESLWSICIQLVQMQTTMVYFNRDFSWNFLAMTVHGRSRPTDLKEYFCWNSVL